MRVKGFVESLVDPSGRIIGSTVEAQALNGQVYCRLHQAGIVTMFLSEEPTEQIAELAIERFRSASDSGGTILIWDSRTGDDRPHRVLIEDETSIRVALERFKTTPKDDSFTFGLKSVGSKFTLSRRDVMRRRIPSLETFWEYLEKANEPYVATVKELWSPANLGLDLARIISPNLLPEDCCEKLRNKIDNLRKKHLETAKYTVVR